MKHPVEHLRFPESTVAAVTEFRQVTGQVLWTDAMMHPTNIALDIGDQGMDLRQDLPLLSFLHAGGNLDERLDQIKLW